MSQKRISHQFSWLDLLEYVLRQIRCDISPVGAGFCLLHPPLLPPPLPRPAPLLPRLSLAVVTLQRAVRKTVRPAAAPVSDPREILFPRDWPWFEILFVLGNAWERHFGWMVVHPGLVAGFLTPPKWSPGPRTICQRPGRTTGGTHPVWVWVVCALRGGHLLGDGPNLLLGDFRVVLDGERNGQVRFVELVPEASEAAHSADARPSHTS